MADYAPVFIPGTAITSMLTTDENSPGYGAVLAGDHLEIAVRSGEVQRAAAASPAYIGIAGFDCDPGKLITIIAGKIVHQGPAEGDIAVRDMVAPSGTDGFQVTATADPVEAIGIAMNTAPDGDICRWIQR
jgi:hypothetical protein